jgi:hypothetical protein
MAVLNQNLNRAFVLSELTPANEISFLNSYKKTLSKCCNDPLRPPRLSECGFLRFGREGGAAMPLGCVYTRIKLRIGAPPKKEMQSVAAHGA